MIDKSMRLISWNIAGRVKACRAQVEVLHRRLPDVVALQEVRESTVSRLRDGLSRIGLEYIEDSMGLVEQHGRRYSELVASRWPLRLLPPIHSEKSFPERVLSVVLNSPWGQIELHTAHIVPGSSKGWKKIEMFESIFNHLAQESEIPRILCGDFNTPQEEKPDGAIVTWGQRKRPDGEIVVKRGYERWDAGERSILEGLAEFDLPDVFRAVNGYEVQEFSWCLKRKGQVIARRRFDHIFASSALNPVECQYLHQVREKGLSDHSAIEAVFEPRRDL